MPRTEAVPVLYIVWYRAGRGHRWRKAGRYSTHAEAMAAIGGPGDWHVAPLHDADLAGDGLFADQASAAEATSDHAEPLAEHAP